MIALLVAAVATFVVSGASGQLYGLRGAGEQLVTIDPETGKMADVGVPRPRELDAQGLSSVDSKRGIFYFVGFNRTSQSVTLVGVGLADGKYKTQNALPLKDGAFVGVGQTCNVEPDSGDVFVSGEFATGGGVHHVIRVTPSTGHYEKIYQITGIDVLGGASSYDPVNHVLWLQLGLKGPPASINFFGVDVQSKTLKWNITDTAIMETIDYDSKTGLMRGIGLQIVHGSTPPYQRTVVTLDSKTGKFAVTCKIEGYFIINGGTSALNTRDRQIFAFLAAEKTTKPLYFVNVDADTCATKRADGCPEPSSCAWNLGFRQ